jgi:hypothetical protein
MVAFCLDDAELLVQRVGAVLACSGQLCDGMYGVGTCPCVRVTVLPRQVLSLNLVIRDISNQLGIRIEPYQSTKLTETLVGLKTFQVLRISVVFITQLLHFYLHCTCCVFACIWPSLLCQNFERSVKHFVRNY